jgi:DNA repair photolyase
MKRFPQKKLRFDERELKTVFPKGSKVFVGSSCDMFAKEIDQYWVRKILEYLKKQEDDATFVFQTKCPGRYLDYNFPKNSILGTTIESNRDRYLEEGLTGGEHPINRANNINFAGYLLEKSTFVTIEPVMDFDKENMAKILRNANPDFINIGADTGRHNLPEPDAEKLQWLIDQFKDKIRIKKNLGRILNNR